MLFGMFNHERILNKQLIDLSTSLVRCKHFTFGNPKKSFSTVLLIIYVISQENKL